MLGMMMSSTWGMLRESKWRCLGESKGRCPGGNWRKVWAGERDLGVHSAQRGVVAGVMNEIAQGE